MKEREVMMRVVLSLERQRLMIFSELTEPRPRGRRSRACCYCADIRYGYGFAIRILGLGYAVYPTLCNHDLQLF